MWRYYYPIHLTLLLLITRGVFCDHFSSSPVVSLGSEINAFEGENNKMWVSKNRVFALGFLEIDVDDDGDADGYVFGIKYNLGDQFANLPVWTVDGGLRVSSNSTFRLAMDGRLILTDKLSKITIWSSNTANLGVKKASLLDNGNFVLLGGTQEDELLWESFGSPTNTLLPGQSLHYPQTLRALSTKSVSSYYSLVIGKTGELELLWEHNVTYWRSHYSSSEARFDSKGVFGLYDIDINRDKPVWSITSKDNGDPSVSLRHLRIDRDGNLRIYSWDRVGHAWKPVWQAVEDQCSVFGSCGSSSICGYNSSGPVCNCLDSGFLETGVGGAGCRRMVDLGSCETRTSIWAMNHTVLYGLYPSHDVQMSLSEAGCRDLCMKDTTCTAATSMNDGSGRCTIKQTSFLSGYKTPYIRAVSFLKVCSVPQATAAAQADHQAKPEPLERVSRNRFIRAIALIALLTASVILSIQFLALSIIYHKQKLKVRTRTTFCEDANKPNPHYSTLVRLSFEEIMELTNCFSNQIGTSVFVGALPNKMPIVAKGLKDVIVSEKEFRVTISTLSATHHRNVASVKAFCFEHANKFLLYEYVPNGSLDKWVHDGKGDNRDGQIWQQKLDIALGVARGLSYLHSECQKCITHGNLKLENVLLDGSLIPKLTNFGLRDLCTKQTASTSSESLSERDIYALGEIYLQILTDERVNVDSFFREAVERMTRIAFWCMQSEPFLRPSAGEVVKVLEGTLSVDRPPSTTNEIEVESLE